MNAPQLGCDYTGHAFGASYPDAACIDGYLWDLDSCDEPGGNLTKGGELACPRCNTAGLLLDALSEAKDGGCGYSMSGAWCAATQWEAACAKALEQNPTLAAEVLAGLGPFETEDWPNREAVAQGLARWDDTVTVTYQGAQRVTP